MRPSDEEVTEHGHRQGGEGGSDRTGPDTGGRQGYSLGHEGDFPFLPRKIKFPTASSQNSNFTFDYIEL